MNTVTEIRTIKVGEQFQYELWGRTDYTDGVVFLGSNDFLYGSREAAEAAAKQHIQEYPDIYEM